MTVEETTMISESSERDFDFLIGVWNVKHHRLKERLAGSTQWLTADATDENHKFLNGLGNIGRFERVFDGKPYQGIPIRIFNPDTRDWRIYWADTVGFEVEPPVIGRFEGGIGTFIGDDEWEGRPVRVRFIWSDITENSARWEQAFSTDNEKTWEVNSIMEFTRAP